MLASAWPLGTCPSPPSVGLTERLPGCCRLLLFLLQVYVHVNNHAGYYPGAGQIDMKLLFDPKVCVCELRPAIHLFMGGRQICLASSFVFCCAWYVAIKAL